MASYRRFKRWYFRAYGIRITTAEARRLHTQRNPVFNTGNFWTRLMSIYIPRMIAQIRTAFGR